MWFRNLQVYRLAKPFKSSPEELAVRLQADIFSGCGKMDMLASGWAPPLGRHGEDLVHAGNGYIMLCLRREEKLIPAGVVRQLLEERVAELEAAEARKVYRREKTRLKEEIIVDLLPRALTRVSDLFAYIDTRQSLLVVDSAAASKSELLVTQLRNTLGRLPATPLSTDTSVSACMTRWLESGRLPDGFELGDDCELRHPQPDGGVVTCKHQDLGADEVQNHIKSGKRAVRLALAWQERINFVLHDDLSIRRVRFADAIHEAAQDTDADDPATRFDLDFALMTLELAAFLPALVAALGGELDGESVPQAAPARVASATPREAEPA